MLTNEQIKQKWLECTRKHRRGDVISSVDMATELARWVEAEYDAVVAERDAAQQRAENAEWELAERKKQLAGAEEALHFFTRSAVVNIDTVRRVREALGNEWVEDDGMKSERERIYYCPTCLNLQGGPHAKNCMAAKVRAALAASEGK